jgi:hypothetical protein
VKLTARDRRIVIVVVLLAAVAGYWLLLLAPKRSEAARLGDEVTAAQTDRDAAVATLERLRAAKTTFATDYAAVVRLGKAVPDDVDMPSLLVQLERAAAVADIDFSSITAGDRQAAVTAAPQATPPSEAGTSGGEPASAPGQAAQGAQDTAAQASAEAAERSGVDPADAQTATAAREGAVPVGGAAGGGPAEQPEGAAPSAPPGLETVALEFDFRGSFFDLASFFHRLKRYVEIANDELVVRGRLLTIDGLEFTSGEAFPDIDAKVHATAYLAPQSQGATAGATPEGPAAATTVSETTP